MSYLTPNMSLVGISIGVDSGITIEQNYNANVAILDQHNHSSGSGVQITPSGLNINAALPFQGNEAEDVGFLNLATLSAAPAINVSVFSRGVDLYFLDGNGNSIQITSGGAVQASISALISGTASASFSSGVLVVDAAANTPGNIKAGSLLLGNNVADSHFLTLAPPPAMGSDYTINLPSLPGAQKFLTLDNSGNMTAAIWVDGSTLTVSTNTLEVAAGGITATQIAAGAVGGTQLATGAVAITNMGAANIQSGSFSNQTIATTFTSTGLSVSITTHGRPVMIVVNNVVEHLSPSAALPNQTMFAQISRDASVVQTQNGGFVFIDQPAAGSHTYTLSLAVGSTTIALDGAMTVWEL